MYRGKLGVLAASVAALPVLAGCSSSSSGGQTAAEASANARASALGITPIPSLAAGAHGPNGDITAPASNPPSKTSPGGSEVFPHITDGKRLDRLRNHLSKFAGVQTVTYYPQFKQLQVYYAKTATSADRARVYDYVTLHYPAATGSPSASPDATSPTPSASAS
ncbi:MAG TPA: hypothetical protein VG650_03005 [Mycobacteriales bacterium]|nr:hypothetical protein [Mycobacteriales bacterium]